MPYLVAFAMAAAISMVAFGALAGVAIALIAGPKGRHRCGRRVRSRRNTVSSRGHRPYRGGRVRV